MNLENMVEGAKLKELSSKVKKVFFYRICGTGMGACACLAKEIGLEVEGADISFAPPMSTYLESSNIPLRKISDVTTEYLKEFDLIIVGNSVPRMSDQARFIEELGVPFCSFPSFLGEFVLKDKEVIGICGTHGKTTTTYFGKQILNAIGEDTGYFIGGVLDDLPPSKLGTSKYFVIESDEYDSAYFQKISKFRLYEIDHLILTSLEFDHADIFDSIEDIKDEFRAILGEFSGQIIANDQYPAINELKTEYKSLNWSIYGEETNLKLLEKTAFQTSFELEGDKFQTNINGTHNILNISSLITLFKKLGMENLTEAVSKLGLVKRRQEVRGVYQGSIVIDDFAHHPKAVACTIEAIKDRFPDKKILTIFEPISATARSSRFQGEFLESLLASDKVIVAENELLKNGSNQLNCEELVLQLNQKNIKATKSDNLEDLQNKIDEWTNEEFVTLVLSNRTCLGLWESDFVKALRPL